MSEMIRSKALSPTNPKAARAESAVLTSYPACFKNSPIISVTSFTSSTTKTLGFEARVFGRRPGRTVVALRLVRALANDPIGKVGSLPGAIDVWYESARRNETVRSGITTGQSCAAIFSPTSNASRAELLCSGQRCHHRGYHARAPKNSLLACALGGYYFNANAGLCLHFIA